MEPIKSNIKMIVLVGQRGVGKTEFLKRCSNYLLNRNMSFVAIDLDLEISRRVKKSISDIFDQMGELKFRELEIETFNQVILENSIDHESDYIADQSSVYEYLKTKYVLVSLGAGFKGRLPKCAQVVWLRRNSDENGRVFLDRPRLDKNLSAYEEYKQRANKRQLHYKEIASEVFWMQEGSNSSNELEEVFLGLKSIDLGGCLTLMPNFFKSPEHTKSFVQKRLSWGINAFEFRSDLLNEKQISLLTKLIPPEKVLMSVRSPSKIKVDFDLYENIDLSIDKSLEAEETLKGLDKAKILSLHGEQGSNILQLINDFERVSGPLYSKKHLKLAPLINTWQELEIGHDWWAKDKLNRSFLPRSFDGRWAWYRLINKNKMALNFWREDEGSCLDQPLLFDWYRFQEDFEKGFAAIIGSPVAHSLTPSEHSPFFKDRDMNIVSIQLDEVNFDRLEFLRKVGLKAAAVTSPLKGQIFDLCTEHSTRALEVKAVNTLCLSKDKIWGDNTDIHGLNELLQNLENGVPIAIWGGGGTLKAILSQLPKAIAFSARTGKVKSLERMIISESTAKEIEPKIVIWGVGRARMSDCQFPPETWRPEKIIDLNYSEDSPGKEWAAKCGAEYVSGLKMFLAQALEQKRIWANYL